MPWSASSLLPDSCHTISRDNSLENDAAGNFNISKTRFQENIGLSHQSARPAPGIAQYVYYAAIRSSHTAQPINVWQQDT